MLEFVVGGFFDSIYSCNGDKFFNVYCLIVKKTGISIAFLMFNGNGTEFYYYFGHNGQKAGFCNFSCELR